MQDAADLQLKEPLVQPDQKLVLMWCHVLSKALHSANSGDMVASHGPSEQPAEQTSMPCFQGHAGGLAAKAAKDSSLKKLMWP